MKKFDLNLRLQVSTLAGHMVAARQGKPATYFTKHTIKDMMKAVTRSDDMVLQLHADYICEKMENWRSCDIGSLQRITKVLW